MNEREVGELFNAENYCSYADTEVLQCSKFSFLMIMNDTRLLEMLEHFSQDRTISKTS